MLKTILFIAWAAIIPIVPLWGIIHYRQKDDKTRLAVCGVLFGIQTFLSIAYIVEYIK